MNIVKKGLKPIIKNSIVILLIVISLSNFAYAEVRKYTTSNIDTIKIAGINEGENDEYWTGFRRSHYGFYPPSTAYKGQSISQTYTYNYIGLDGIVRTKTETIDKQMIGYGYYSFDYRRHIAGLLYYIKSKLSLDDNEYKDYETNCIEEYEEDDEIRYRKLYMTEVCNKLFNEIVTNQYSDYYRDTIFLDYYQKSFLSTQENLLKKLENEFYLKAYGKNAIKYLTSFGIKPELVEKRYEPAIRGAIWSITEERYRRKNLGKKSNLQLEVDAGEVLPFLLYIDCEYTDSASGRSYSNIKFEHKIVDDKGNVTYRTDTKIDIDQVIDGAYQYMVYYYDNTSNNNNTVFSSDDDSDYDSMSDFREEYEELTNRPFPVLKGKELDLFLIRVKEKEGIFKKSKGNSYGAFGVDEEYNIESEINYSRAIRDMKEAMIKTIGKEAFAGMKGEENIARTYLMAKNIVDSNRVRDEYSYYDIGTNVITKTLGESDNVVLLSDFQKVRLDSPILTKDGKTHEDTDGDGIYDCNELGDSKKVDITYFVWKTLYAELFGKEKATPEKISIVNSLIDQYKINVSDKNNNSRENNGYEYHFDWNGDMNPKRGLIVETYSYRSNPILKDTDFDGIDDGKGIEELARLEREKEQNAITYDMMKNDLRPLSNHFIGKMHSTRLSGEDGIEVDMTMDYRYFLMDNRNYYDELSTMSLLYANSIYQQGRGQDKHSGIEILDVNNKEIEKNLRVKDMMKFFGFRDVETYYLGEEGSEASDDSDYNRGYKDTHKSKVAIGYKNIEYHGIYKTVVGIVIRGTAEDDDWDSDFDMGDLDLRDAINEHSTMSGKSVNSGHENIANNIEVINSYLNGNGNKKYDHQYNTELSHFAYGYPDWKNIQHHAGFDIVANRIIEIIGEYMEKEHDMDGDICYWVTGHSMGGGVANLVAAELLHGKSGINNRTDNVYCYTFAAPNTFYITDNTNTRRNVVFPDKTVTETYREPHGIKYRCIFNIVNDDDFVPKLPMEECEWTKYGRMAKVSMKSLIHTNDYGLSIYNYKWRHEFDEYNMSFTNFEKFVYGKYSSYANKENVNRIIEEFNNIYNNDQRINSNMRSNSYIFNINDTISKNKISEFSNSDNTKPYQKIFTDYNKYYQIQTPAYFVQSISHSMHEHKDKSEGSNNSSYSGDDADPDGVFGNSNKRKLFYLPLAKRYVLAKNKVISGRNNIELPHTLEAYYYLTKRIEQIIFR